jgi:hypothetical protein
MSKLSFELTRTDVKIKGNYFLLIQLEETEFPSKLTKIQKFRTEIDYSTQFPVFHQNYYSFNLVNLGNKLLLRIGLYKVKNPDKLKRKIKIEDKKKVEDINKPKPIKNDINPKLLFSESELIGKVNIELDSVWIENLRKCKYVESDSKLYHPEKNNEESAHVFYKLSCRSQTIDAKIYEDNQEIEKVFYDPFEKDKEVIRKKLKSIIILNEEKQIQLNEMQKKLDEANNKAKYNVKEKNKVEKKLKETVEENKLLRRNLAKIQSYDEIDIEIDLLSQSQQGIEIIEKKYAVLLGQISLQKQLKYELENNYKEIKTLLSKIKIVQNRYDTLKDANNQLKFKYNVKRDMLPLLQNYEEKMKNNNKLIQNYRDNILDVIKLRKQNSSLTIEELENKIEKFTKERHKLEEKKVQLNLYLDIYMKEKNNANATYEEISGPFDRIIGNDPLMNQIKYDGENELLNINNRAIEELNNTIKDLSKKISDFEEREKEKKAKGIIIEPSLIMKRNNLKIKVDEELKKEKGLAEEYEKNKEAFLNAKEVLKDRIAQLDSAINQELKYAKRRRYEQELNALNQRYFYDNYM